MKKCLIGLFVLCLIGCKSIDPKPLPRSNNDLMDLYESVQCQYGSFPTDQIDFHICRDSFCLGFDSSIGQARWVRHTLDKQKLNERKRLHLKRKDEFRPDPLLGDKSPDLIDYRGSGYDRGHLAPCADLAWSAKSMSESFYLSNMSPQTKECNQVTWRMLEDEVRGMVELSPITGKVYIVSGPIITNQYPKVIGKTHQIQVPDAYYKVISIPEWNKTIGFVITNGKSNPVNPLFYKTNIQDIEQMTGLDL